MNNLDKSYLKYFKSAVGNTKIVHSFKLIGNELEVERLAKNKALELDGEYTIIRFSSDQIIRVAISYEHNLLTANLDRDLQQMTRS